MSKNFCLKRAGGQCKIGGGGGVGGVGWGGGGGALCLEWTVALL